MKGGASLAGGAEGPGDADGPPEVSCATWVELMLMMGAGTLRACNHSNRGRFRPEPWLANLNQNLNPLLCTSSH